jgi:hypothetical protein
MECSVGDGGVMVSNEVMIKIDEEGVRGELSES